MLLLPIYSFIVKIGCAFMTGAIIGFERQCKQRNAGLRTNTLVSVGSAAFVLVSGSLTESNGDPSRIAAQIVTGVGFLGGGLILKDGLNVRGLNSAATIWCSAACGTLSGVGLYFEAFILVGMVLLIHVFLEALGRRVTHMTTQKVYYSIKADCSSDLSEKVQQSLLKMLSFDKKIRLNSLYYKPKCKDSVTVCCLLESDGESLALMHLMVSRLRSDYGIVQAGWEDITNSSFYQSTHYN